MQWIHPVDQYTIAVQYKHVDEHPYQDITSSVVVASFVTAYGRLRLHRMMVSLEGDLIYVDTGELKCLTPLRFF